jgi:3-oxoacyl-[acyl-carrier protein] reductase
MDVTDREQVSSVFAQVKQEFGRIDILVNNAATLDNTAQIPKQDYALWDRDIAVNLTGSFNCTKEVWPYMVEQRWGRLIYMSSIAGSIGGFGQASYAATKAGVVGLMRTAALEGGRHGITANAVAPGIALSEAARVAEATNPMYERFKNRTVFKRFGEPGDVSAAIAYLCSDEAGYVTGVVLGVDGGMSLFTA